MARGEGCFVGRECQFAEMPAGEPGYGVEMPRLLHARLGESCGMEEAFVDAVGGVDAREERCAEEEEEAEGALG